MESYQELDYSKSFEVLPEPYLLLSPDFYILTANRAYLKATHTNLQQIQGKYVFDAFPDNPATPEADSVKNLKASLETVVTTGEPHKMAIQRYDVLINYSSREFEKKYWRPVNTPVLDEHGELRYIIHHVTDVTREAEVEQKLSESDELIKRAEKVVHTGSYEINLATGKMIFSDGMFRLFAEKPQSFEPTLDFIDARSNPEDAREVRRVLDRAAMDKGSYYYTRRILRSDNEWRKVESHGTVVEDANGNAIKFFGVVQDITGRERVEEEIKESRKLLQITIDSSLDTIVVLEAVRDENNDIIDFRYKLLNSEADKVLGNVLGESMLLHQPGVEAEGIFDIFKQVVATGIPYQHEKHYAHEQMNSWFHQSVVKLGDGVATTNTNITKRKEAEEEIIRLKEAVAKKVTDKYITLFNSIDEAVAWCEIITDETGKAIDYRLLELNPAFEKITGLTVEDSKGKRAKEVVPTLEDHWFEAYERVALGKESLRFEYEAEGLGRWFSAFASPVSNGERGHFVVVYSDITERKQLEEKQAYLLQLSDAVRTLSDPAEILDSALKVVAEYLDLDRIGYNEIDPAITEYWYRACYARAGFTPVIGRFEMGPFQETVKNLQKGITFIAKDAFDDSFSEAEKEVHRSINVGAYVTVPLVKAGRWVCNLVAHYSKPRNWTKYEIDILEETAERVWAAVERANAEEALRQSEAQLKAVFEGLPVGVAVINTDGKVILSNKEMHRFLPNNMMPSRDESYYNWLAYNDKGSRATREEFPGARAARGEKVISGMEMLYTEENGTQIWTRVSAVPIRGGNDEIIGQVAVVTNIDELKQFNQKLEQQVAERTQALKESKDQFEAAMDVSPNVLSLLKSLRNDAQEIVDFKFDWVSRGGEELVGIDVTDQNILTSFPHLKEIGVFEKFVSTVETGEPTDYECLYDKEGYNYWIRWRAVKLDDGLFVSLENITDRKQSEAELIKNLAILKQSEEVASIGSWEYDIETDEMHWSEGMYRLFEIPPGTKVAPETYLDYVVPEDREKMLQMIDAIKRTFEPLEEEIGIFVEGKRKLLGIKAVAYRNATKQPVKMLGVDMDITLTKEAEAKLRQAEEVKQKEILNAVMQTQEEERRRIAEALHNDFGQLLTGAKMQVPSANRELGALLNTAIKKVRAVSHELMPQLLNDYGLEIALRDLFDNKLGESDISYSSTIEKLKTRLPQVTEIAIFRLIQEIINNIVKHAKATKVTIKIVKEDALIIDIADNGIGIFENAERKGKKTFGLSYIHSRVHLLNGTLQLKTAENLGTQFMIEIPIEKS